MSTSLLNAHSVHATSLDECADETVAASLKYEPGSRWTKLLLRLMAPLKLHLSKLELLLLTVAFGSEIEARRSWERFSASGVSLEELNTSNYGIFPALTRRLTEIAPDERYMKKLRGHERYTWIKNQLKLKELAESITILAANGVPCIVSKEVGLSLIPDMQCGLRKLDCVALLVSPENFVRAQGLLSQSNASVHVLKHLHGNVDARVWRDALAVEICGVTALSLSSSDLLFQHLLSAKFEGANQREWFGGCLRLLPLFDNEIHLRQLRDRIESSCSVLDALQAWYLFLRIADLTHCPVRDSELCKTFASLHVSCKELLYHLAHRLHTIWSSMKRD